MENLVSWLVTLTVGALWPEAEMLWSGTLGKSAFICSQWPWVGGAEE